MTVKPLIHLLQSGIIIITIIYYYYYYSAPNSCSQGFFISTKFNMPLEYSKGLGNIKSESHFYWQGQICIY